MSARSAGVTTQQRVAPDRQKQVLDNRRVTVKMPVSVTTMRTWLDLYPNRDAAGTLLKGFSDGFLIPFVYSSDSFASVNLKSARENTGVLHVKVQMEVHLGRMEGPFDEMPFSNLRVSP